MRCWQNFDWSTMCQPSVWWVAIMTEVLGFFHKTSQEVCNGSWTSSAVSKYLTELERRSCGFFTHDGVHATRKICQAGSTENRCRVSGWHLFLCISWPHIVCFLSEKMRATKTQSTKAFQTHHLYKYRLISTSLFLLGLFKLYGKCGRIEIVL